MSSSTPRMPAEQSEVASASRVRVRPVRSLVDRALAAPGRPLDEPTRATMERRLGHDFSGVRVHTDSGSAATAGRIGARAFSRGNDIVFSANAYAPHTPDGQRLLAHELVHVAQYRAHPARENERLRSTSDQPAERQARAVAQRVASSQPIGAWQPVAPQSQVSLDETWFRGEVEGVAPAKDFSTGRGVVHDLGEGTYFSDTQSVAEEYAATRGDANTAAGARRVLRGQVNPAALGKVLDLTKDPEFMKLFNRVKLSLGDLTGEPYRNLFEGYLKDKGLKRADFHIIIGPEGRLGGKQMCVRDPGVLKKVLSVMTAIKPGGGTPGPGGAPGGGEPPPQSGGSKPPAAPQKAAPPGPRPSPGKVGRFAIGSAKFFGPMILHGINQYFMAKEDAERAQQMIVQKLESSDVEKQVSDLVDRQRFDIARKQYRGSTVYATVDLKLTFTNDVMNTFTLTKVSLGATDESRFMSTVMSHDVLNNENKVWYVTSSAALPPVPVSEIEDRKLRIELLEEQATTTTLEPRDAANLSDERNRLLADLRRLEQEEEKAGRAEIARPGVIADAKKRAAQQAELTDQLRKLGDDKTPQTKAQVPPPTAGSSFVPGPAAQPPALLPGAPGDGPIEQAAQVAKSAAVWSEQLSRKGAALQARLGSNNPPSAKEREAFFKEEQSWRVAIKYAMNALHNRQREEAVNALGELLDRYGPVLARYRTHLGGSE